MKVMAAGIAVTPPFFRKTLFRAAAVSRALLNSITAFLSTGISVSGLFRSRYTVPTFALTSWISPGSPPGSFLSHEKSNNDKMISHAPVNPLFMMDRSLKREGPGKSPDPPVFR